ncbi:uncharacterized protein LOC110882395 [Helianthus annuus]|uniref:uncharacterized protein LOC110882395 n=1 Tax=Helianthus annuus TaxID=4232 RepID=UPI000B8F4B04|nr:uncharacterized protein LOC110882395 [Helianthus annuus]
MDKYLELKARQAKIRAKIECEGQIDEAISEKLEFLLTKVKQMEDYAQDLSKEKKQELVDAKVDTAIAIAKWTKQYTDETYERLKKRRITVSDTPKRPDYKMLEQQIDDLKTLLTSTDNPILVANQEKEKLLTSEEAKEKEAEYFTEAIKKMDLKEDRSAKLQDLAKKVLTKPASPNDSAEISDIEPDQQKRQEQIEKETAEDIAAANDVIEMAFKQMSDSLQLFTRPTSPNSSLNKSPPRNPLGMYKMDEIKPFKDTRTEEQKLSYRKQRAHWRMMRISRIYYEAKMAKRWDVNRECYLDPEGNIAIDDKTLSEEALVECIAEEEEALQRKWWGGDKENVKEKDETLNDNEADPSSAGDHDEEVATGNQLAVNGDQEAENMPIFDHGDSDSEQEQISSKTKCEVVMTEEVVKEAISEKQQVFEEIISKKEESVKPVSVKSETVIKKEFEEDTSVYEIVQKEKKLAEDIRILKDEKKAADEQILDMLSIAKHFLHQHHLGRKLPKEASYGYFGKMG